MFGLILRFIWFILALLGVRFALRWLARRSDSAPPAAPPGPAGRTSLRGAMVKDPVCGTWLDPQIALSLKRGSEVVYFCSESCRDEYRSWDGK